MTTTEGDYEVGARLCFPWTGGVYLITEVNREARTVTFAVPSDPEDSTTETFDELAAVDAEVLS